MAKTNKNKKSKLSSLFNTGSKQLIAFVLAFAIIGGGIYAYRSFAHGSAKAHKPVSTVDVVGYGSSSINLLNYQRHCTYVSLQKKVGTGSWLSVSNDTACHGSASGIGFNVHTSRPNQCTQFRTYAKGWLDEGSGTREHHVVTDTSSTRSVNC